MANEYLKRTPTSTGNRKVWTLSAWVKINNPDTNGNTIFSVSDGTSNNRLWIRYRSAANSAIQITQNQGGVNNIDLQSSSLYRDVSSWQHVLVVFNSTSGSSYSDTIQFYINGSLITDFQTTTYSFSQNGRSELNKVNYIHQIGDISWGAVSVSLQYTDVFLVDGQALTPDVFGFYKDGKGYQSSGTTNATDFRPGQWVPKAPRVIKAQIERNGGFGVNGFYLPMNDISNFGADFHTTPNSIITLKGEDLPQPRNGAPETTDAYVSQLRTDPYAANLVLAVPGIIGGASTGYGDYSADIKGSGSNKTLTAVGNAGVAVTASYYGSALSFPGASGDYISTPSDSDFAFGTGDFTVECWVNPQTVNTYHQYFDTRGSAANSTTGFSLGYTSGNFYIYTNTFNIQTATVLSQLTHIALERQGSNLTLYKNGVAAGIQTNFDLNLTNNTIYLGATGTSDTSQYFKGYLQDLRVYKGVAKYKGGFDVPKPYTPVGIGTWRAVPDCTANNFATLNPLANGNATGGSGTLSYSNGNNTITMSPNSVNNATFGTVGVNTGKWYWEGRLDTAGGLHPFIGISSQLGISSAQNTTNYGQSGTGVYKGSGTLSAGDIVGVAVSFTSAGVGSTVTFYVNGVESTSGIGNRSRFDGQTNTWLPGVSLVNAGVWSINFGQNPTFSGNTTAGTFTDSNGKGLFKYEPPSDFLALCEDNLPTPAIKNPGEYFKTVLYHGDSNDGRSITGVGFKPDLVWIKERTSSSGHYILDSLRGATNYIRPNETNAEASSDQTIKSFDFDGFTLGDSGAFNADDDYVAWCWKAGGSAVTNTDGSITSQVSVNQDAGFSIVSYTGNEIDNATVGHGLGKVPDMIIVKNRNSAVSWGVWHSSLLSGQVLRLDNTTEAQTPGTAYFQDENNTSSVFALGTNDETNDSDGDTYIAYCWAEIESFSKFGSYVGNGNADGPFVYCGFKPAWIIFKRTDTTGSWVIKDSSRKSTNPQNSDIFANTSDVESDVFDCDFLSNGFKLRDTVANTSNGTYIFAAFAESPFTTANAK
jgi:hypothetical protein